LLKKMAAIGISSRTGSIGKGTLAKKCKLKEMVIALRTPANYTK